MSTSFDINEPFQPLYGKAMQGIICIATFYQNGQKALQLLDKANHEKLHTASVAIDLEPQGPAEIFIKDWSENEGVYDELVRLKVIHPFHRKTPTGIVEAKVCYIHEQYLRYWLDTE